MPLCRADRLFDIIRILRAASRPVTAAAIGDELEVTVRTVGQASAGFPNQVNDFRFARFNSLLGRKIRDQLALATRTSS